jgi:hypothetical protein
MTREEKVAKIRSYGFWVRECESGPVAFIIVDPLGNEDGFMVAGGPEVLDEALDQVDDVEADLQARGV